jgi:hypothetical protein
MPLWTTLSSPVHCVYLPGDDGRAIGLGQAPRNKEGSQREAEILRRFQNGGTVNPYGKEG